MNVLLIGAGFWGAKILNTLKKFNDINIKVFDTNQKVVNELINQNVSIANNLNESIADPNIDVVFVITPPHSHFELADQALKNNKHVFVEKPITLTHDGALNLKKTAEDNNKILHTDNTFIYTPEVNFLKQVINFDFIGKITNFESTRANWGPFKKDIDVVWDLMTHDISILNYIIPNRYILQGVSATGSNQVNKNVIEKARATLFYSNDFTAYIDVSFLNHNKVRKMTLNGTSGIVHNDSAFPDAKLIIERRNETPRIYEPQQLIDPLYLEINHFFESIKQNKNTLSGASEGVLAVKILEKISESIKNNGKYINTNE
jgi:predicted dehydrogenase